MYRITLILILFLLIPDVYIYLVYIRRKTQNVRLRWLHWLPSIAILVSYVYLMYLTGDNPMSNHSQGIGYVAVAALLFISSKTVFLICSVVGVFCTPLFVDAHVLHSLPSASYWAASHSDALSMARCGVQLVLKSKK